VTGVQPVATCPVCGKLCAVNLDGTIRRHDRERLHLPPQRPCIGSYRTPAPRPAD
jgi:hypothetical protein